MVEVFATNVNESRQANRIIEQIQQKISTYTASFDLEDCDKILRVQSATGRVEPARIIALVWELGFQAQVLPDDEPVMVTTP